MALTLEEKRERDRGYKAKSRAKTKEEEEAAAAKAKRDEEEAAAEKLAKHNRKIELQRIRREKLKQQKKMSETNEPDDPIAMTIATAVASGNTTEGGYKVFSELASARKEKEAGRKAMMQSQRANSIGNSITKVLDEAADKGLETKGLEVMEVIDGVNGYPSAKKVALMKQKSDEETFSHDSSSVKNLTDAFGDLDTKLAAKDETKKKMGDAAADTFEDEESGDEKSGDDYWSDSSFDADCAAAAAAADKAAAKQKLTNLVETDEKKSSKKGVTFKSGTKKSSTVTSGGRGGTRPNTKTVKSTPSRKKAPPPSTAAAAATASGGRGGTRPKTKTVKSGGRKTAPPPAPAASGGGGPRRSARNRSTAPSEAESEAESSGTETPAAAAAAPTLWERHQAVRAKLAKQKEEGTLFQK